MSSVPVVVTPLSVTAMLPVRGVGTSAVVTLNVPEEPESDTVVGHVRPWPVQAMVAVCADSNAAVSETVTGTVEGDRVDTGFGVTLATVGGKTVSAAERDCPPAVAVIVTVRDVGTTCVPI